MNYFKKNTLFLLLLCLINCGSFQSNIMSEINNFEANFEDNQTFKKNWESDSWKSPNSYYLENGTLIISTRPNTKDRVKVRTKKRGFSAGTYVWRVFVPKFNLYEQASIGAFLYHHSVGKEFEFDFEIGSGQKTDREKINLKDDEAIVFCVSQFSPSNSSHFGVKMGEWSEFTMELTAVNGFYLVKWYINKKLVKSLQTAVKSTVNFRVHNSLENLHFMGDKLPSKKNVAEFDFFKYSKN